MHRYSERALVKVCYMIALVVVSVIIGISYCLNKVLEHIT